LTWSALTETPRRRAATCQQRPGSRLQRHPTAPLLQPSAPRRRSCWRTSTMPWTRAMQVRLAPARARLVQGRLPGHAWSRGACQGTPGPGAPARARLVQGRLPGHAWFRGACQGTPGSGAPAALAGRRIPLPPHMCRQFAGTEGLSARHQNMQRQQDCRKQLWLLQQPAAAARAQQQPPSPTNPTASPLPPAPAAPWPQAT